MKESVNEQQASVQEELAFKDQTVYSYQQISCLDSVIRYSFTDTIANNSDHKKKTNSNNITIKPIFCVCQNAIY